MFESIHEVAILVTAILAVAVGSVWYSPLLFGNIWMKSLGIHPGEELMPAKEMKKAILLGIVSQAVFFTAVALLIEMLMPPVSQWNVAGLLLLMLGVHMYSNTVWEKKPFAYFLVHIGYTGFVLFAGLAVITYWPW